jgi:hypothetical protein
MAGIGYKYKFKKLIALGIDFNGSIVRGSIFYETQGMIPYYYNSYGGQYISYTRVQTNSVKFTYFTAPVYMNFFYKRCSIDLGFQSSYAFSRVFIYGDKWTYGDGNSTSSASSSSGKDSYLRNYDYGPFAALNMNVWKGLDLSIRCYKGFPSLYVSNLSNTQLMIGLRYNFFDSQSKGNGPEKAVNESK